MNRERIYDFYAKEAEYFRKQSPVPLLAAPVPGLDGGSHGHWGNQNEETWADGRWNQTELGSVLSGVFRGAGVTVPKGVCVRLGEHGELGACFNPETLCYEAVWRGGFVRFSATRHGFLDGLIMNGTAPAPPGGNAARASRSPTAASTGTATAWSSPTGSATRTTSTRPGSRTASSRGPSPRPATSRSPT